MCSSYELSQLSWLLSPAYGFMPNPLSITVLMMWASTATQLSMPCALLLGSKAKQRRRSCSSFTITALLCFCCCAENVAENLSLMVLSNDRKQEKAFYCFHSKKSHIQNYKKSLGEREKHPQTLLLTQWLKKKVSFYNFCQGNWTLKKCIIIFAPKINNRTCNICHFWAAKFKYLIQ